MNNIATLRRRQVSLWLAALIAAGVAPLTAEPSGLPAQIDANAAVASPMGAAPPGDAPEAGVPGGQRVTPQIIPAALDEAVHMVFSGFRVRADYEYVMTGKIRILLFWIGRDDVGDGRITLEQGVDRPELDAIRLKIGSDPAKAPRGINRWGAAAEIVEYDAQRSSVVSTAFFGFMKATEGATIDAVEAELGTEGEQQRHVFEASINRIERSVALSSVLPIVSTVDFHIGELAEAERMVREQYERAFRLSDYQKLNGTSRGACERSESFLFTLKEVIDANVAARTDGRPRCFVYNSKLYTLTLTGQRPRARIKIAYELVDGTEVQHDYNDVIEMEFESRNQLTGWTEDFTLLVGTTGDLRGVPVQITYQPNFWFKAILNLHRTAGAQRSASGSSGAPRTGPHDPATDPGQIPSNR